MMKLKTIPLTIPMGLSLFVYCVYETQAQPCAPLTFPGKDTPVCVCNCTYCDKIEPIGNIDSNTVVTYTTTKNGKRLERSTSTKTTLLTLLNSVTNLVRLNLTATFQNVSGFGGALAWYTAANIMTLANTCSSSTSLKDTLLQSLFSPDGGWEFNHVRLMMTVGDSIGQVTYDDTPGDFNLNNFKLALEDTQNKIPILHQAQQLTNNNLKVMASSWSAPAWMKRCNCTFDSNFIDLPFQRMLYGDPSEPADSQYYQTLANYFDQYIEAYLANDTAVATQDYAYLANYFLECLLPSQTNNITSNSQYYQTWADYFVKYIQAYEANNVSIWAVTTQNEPATSIVSTNDPTQAYYPWTEKDHIKYHLGPALDAAGLNTKLFIYDDSRYPFLPGWIACIVDDPEAAQYISGIAMHWYLDFATPPELLDTIHLLYPDLEIMNTESTGFSYGLGGYGIQPSTTPALGTWQIAADLSKAIIQGMNHWETGWMYYEIAQQENMANDQLIIVNATTQEFYKAPHYYAFGHFSKFVPPGSKRIGLTIQTVLSLDLPCIAFQRPDGIIAVIAVNDLNQELIGIVLAIANELTGKSITLNLPPNSITTTLFQP